MPSEVKIRFVRPEDAAALLEIYRPYVEETAISFEYDTPTLEEFSARIARISEKYPYLVAEADGQLLGYAYAGAFVGRAAYRWSAESTIYLKQSVRKQGVGRKLYEALEQVLRAMHIYNLNACIGLPEVEDAHLTNNSVEFHAHMGYRMVGKFTNSGYKFDTWYHMVWMEKILAPHPAYPIEPLSIQTVRESIAFPSA